MSILHSKSPPCFIFLRYRRESSTAHLSLNEKMSLITVLVRCTGIEHKRHDIPILLPPLPPRLPTSPSPHPFFPSPPFPLPFPPAKISKCPAFSAKFRSVRAVSPEVYF